MFWAFVDLRELDSIDACRPIDVTCGWVGEASFGDEGLAHVAFSAIFFATAIFVATAILDQRLFSLATAFPVLATFLLHRRAFLTDGYFDIIFLSSRRKRS